jgi:hypothetical protein
VTTQAIEKSEAVSLRRSFWLQILTSAVAGVVGCATFTWNLRGNLAEEERSIRSAIAEQQLHIAVLEARREDELQSISEIKTDVKAISQQLRTNP